MSDQLGGVMKANERACPRCAEPVKLDATACRHCGYEFTAEEIAAAQAKKKAQARQGIFGCLGCGGLIAVIAIIVAISGGSSTGGKEAEASRLEATADKIDAEANRVEQSDGKQALVNNYRTMLKLAKGCDPMIGAIGDAAKTGSPVAMFAAAKEGQARCQEAWLGISKLSPADGLPDAVREKEQKAIKTCGSAYFLRQRAMETAMEVADGDAKPSKIASIQEDLQTGQGGVMLCVAEYFDAAGAAGVKTDQLR